VDDGFIMITRRSLLKLFATSAAVLMLGGGAALLVRPVWAQGKLLPDGRNVMMAIAKTVLDGGLPADALAQSAALSELMQRIELALSAFPKRTQDEFTQLLGLLAHPWSRMAMGMGTDWTRATVDEVSGWLQSQRISSLDLKQQAYHALHDLTLAAWFSDKSACKAIGYELPVTV
jgi:hypothetical protein